MQNALASSVKYLNRAIMPKEAHSHSHTHIPHEKTETRKEAVQKKSSLGKIPKIILFA